LLFGNREIGRKRKSREALSCRDKDYSEDEEEDDDDDADADPLNEYAELGNFVVMPGEEDDDEDEEEDEEEEAEMEPPSRHKKRRSSQIVSTLREPIKGTSIRNSTTVVNRSSLRRIILESDEEDE
jgi:hypothetical protein